MIALISIGVRDVDRSKCFLRRGSGAARIQLHQSRENPITVRAKPELSWRR